MIRAGRFVQEVGGDLAPARAWRDSSMGTQKLASIHDGPTKFPTGNGADPDRTMAAGVTDAAPASHHPATIGRYHILHLLGEGGMGSVYLAEQENPHRVVALKV